MQSPMQTTRAARSANPSPKSRRSRARDQGRAHRIATDRRMLCSLGLSVAPTRASVNAEQALGSHHTWRYQKGVRVVFIGGNCGTGKRESAAQNHTLIPKTAICRAPPTMTSHTDASRKGPPATIHQRARAITAVRGGGAGAVTAGTVSKHARVTAHRTEPSNLAGPVLTKKFAPAGYLSQGTALPRP